jgi:hypothetical protein
MGCILFFRRLCLRGTEVIVWHEDKFCERKCNSVYCRDDEIRLDLGLQLNGPGQNTRNKDATENM